MIYYGSHIYVLDVDLLQFCEIVGKLKKSRL